MQPPCILAAGHNVLDFDCQEVALNQYLQKHALQSQRSFGTVTYVALEDNTVIGYYTLLYGAVSLADSPVRLSKGLGNYPDIPVLIIARLAVDKKYSGKGIGSGLLKDALVRAYSASKAAGLRAVIVHAKTSNLKHFYESFGFESLPENPLHLHRLMSDIKKDLRQAGIE